MCSLNFNEISIKHELYENNEADKELLSKNESIIISNETIVTKCGEVIFKNQSLLFSCNFCEIKYSKIKSFVFHLMTLHLRNHLCDSLLQQIFDEDEVDDKKRESNENAVSKTEDSQSPSYTQVVEEKSENLTDSYEDECRINGISQSGKNYKKLHDTTTEDEEDHNYENSEEEKISNENLKISNKKFRSNKKRKLNKTSIACKICNQIFRRLCDYKRHENGGHGADGGKKKYKYKYVYDTKRFICETCGKGFKTNYHLKQHQNAHTGERPYKCDLCPQTFAKSRHMVFHMRYHLNDRRYKCQYCDKAFVEQTKRRLHEMIHTGTFPFKCSQCDKGFRCRSKLNVHLKRHENDRMYKCDKCDKSFFDINLLRGHAAVHSNEKPFACEMCPARFPRKGALRLHMHLHSDKKKYCCKVCGKEFHQYNGIYTHMKSHGIKYSTAYEKGECDGRSEVITVENQEICQPKF